MRVLVKKIISVALSEESITTVDETSKALGMNRSELLEFMISKGWNFSDELVALVDQIKNLQEKATKQMEDKKK